MCRKMSWATFTLVCTILYLDLMAQGFASEPACFAPRGNPCLSPPVLKRNCPIGFDQFETHCIKVTAEELPRKEAQQKCEDMNAKLAEPEDIYDYFPTDLADYFLESMMSICVHSANSYSQCTYNGEDYNSGQLVVMDTQYCQQIWCQDGEIQPYTCESVTAGCCEKDGKFYADGVIIDDTTPSCPKDMGDGGIKTKEHSAPFQQVCQNGVVQFQDCLAAEEMICKEQNSDYYKTD